MVIAQLTSAEIDTRVMGGSQVTLGGFPREDIEHPRVGGDKEKEQRQTGGGGESAVFIALKNSSVHLNINTSGDITVTTTVHSHYSLAVRPTYTAFCVSVLILQAGRLRPREGKGHPGSQACWRPCLPSSHAG